MKVSRLFEALLLRAVWWIGMPPCDPHPIRGSRPDARRLLHLA